MNKEPAITAEEVAERIEQFFYLASMAITIAIFYLFIIGPAMIFGVQGCEPESPIDYVAMVIGGAAWIGAAWAITN